MKTSSTLLLAAATCVVGAGGTAAYYHSHVDPASVRALTMYAAAGFGTPNEQEVGVPYLTQVGDAARAARVWQSVSGKVVVVSCPLGTPDALSYNPVRPSYARKDCTVYR